MATCVAAREELMTPQAAAERWETEWPAFRRKLAVNPYLVLTGFVPLVNRLEVEREDLLTAVEWSLTAS